MKTVITIKKSDGTGVTIFTSHIAYIEHAAGGCVIYTGAASSYALIATAYTWEELVLILEKD